MNIRHINATQPFGYGIGMDRRSGRRRFNNAVKIHGEDYYFVSIRIAGDFRTKHEPLVMSDNPLGILLMRKSKKCVQDCMRDKAAFDSFDLMDF